MAKKGRRKETSAQKRARRVRAVYRIQKNWNCHLCGERIHDKTQLTFDHLQVASRGGPDAASNLRFAHQKCNLERSNTELTYYRMQGMFQRKFPITAKRELMSQRLGHTPVIVLKRREKNGYRDAKRALEERHLRAVQAQWTHFSTYLMLSYMIGVALKNLVF